MQDASEYFDIENSRGRQLSRLGSGHARLARFSTLSCTNAHTHRWQDFSSRFVSAGACFVAIAAIGTISTRRLVGDAKWVSHTRAVRGELQQVSRHVDAAKADIRGFLLTNDSAYVRRHRANLDSTEAAFRRVEALTSDNPVQQTRLTAIRALLTERESAEKTLSLRNLPQSSPGDVAERLTIGELLTTRVDSAIRAADDAERQLLAALSVQQAASAKFVDLHRQRLLWRQSLWACCFADRSRETSLIARA